jgi:hypothetical protein
VKQIVSLVLVLALASVASAQLSGTSITHGRGMTHHSFSDGSFGTSIDHGLGMTHHSFSDGSSGTSITHGLGMTHHSFTPGPATGASGFGWGQRPVTTTNDAILDYQRGQQQMFQQQQSLQYQQLFQQQLRLNGMSGQNKKTSDALRANADRRRAAKK